MNNYQKRQKREAILMEVSAWIGAIALAYFLAEMVGYAIDKS